MLRRGKGELPEKEPAKAGSEAAAESKSGPAKAVLKQAASQKKGHEGEEAVARFLKKKGWRILDCNWRHARLELDLVCRDGDTVVFVEVKTRASGGMTGSVDAFTPEKQRRITRAAQAWLTEHDAWNKPCRFDLASVTLQDGHYTTELFSHVIELGSGPGHAYGRGNTAWQPW